MRGQDLAQRALEDEECADGDQAEAHEVAQRGALAEPEDGEAGEEYRHRLPYHWIILCFLPWACGPVGIDIGGLAEPRSKKKCVEKKSPKVLVNNSSW